MKAIKHPIESMPRGSILTLTAVLLFAFFGLAALAVDIGVIATARAQLETVADAAALAGAMQLAINSSDPTVAQAQAQTQAIAIGQANYVLNQPAVIDANDVEVNIGTNSVKVTAKRSGDHVGLVPAFFSSLLGYSSFPVSVSSTATWSVNPVTSQPFTMLTVLEQ
jgi:Flp pilus assembly protein TadG